MFEFLPDAVEISEKLGNFITKYPAIIDGITFFTRYALMFLSLFIVISCAVSLLRGKNSKELWGYMSVDGINVPIGHWENTIGRSKASDIVVNKPAASRSHAVISRHGDGVWTITDIGSKSGTFVNGQKITQTTEVNRGDIINIGGSELILVPAKSEEKQQNRILRASQSIWVSPALILFWLSEFQIFTFVQLLIATYEDFTWWLPFVFLALFLVMWIWYFVFRTMKRRGFEIDTIGFYLSTIGLMITAETFPSDVFKQFCAMILGLLVFIILGLILRDLHLTLKLRWPAAAASIAFMLITLVLGRVQYGAKNWIRIAGISLQLSEFVKVMFIFAGAATLERLYTRRNLILFIMLSGFCVCALALQKDFGTALIFFVTFIVIAYLRSGDIASIALICAGAAFGGFLVIQAMPHVASRFESWRHVWEFAQSSGYQQTRTMSAAASGGLFGIGIGNGWLKNIGAASTDLVFGILCEEMGLIVALCAIAAIVILVIFTVKSASMGRSSYYVIVACAAASMMSFQIILNVFGSVDILPLTGVTFPFVSTGGSSMVACWGLFAFIKAGDTRQNASFVVKLDRHKGEGGEEL